METFLLVTWFWITSSVTCYNLIKLNNVLTDYDPKNSDASFYMFYSVIAWYFFIPVCTICIVGCLIRDFVEIHKKYKSGAA